ncbi:hypothetical protein CIPAW_03G155700 [Carya illinoinensis]|uniref:Uncharacterized protein n=1 Tax=Carya illinoinensis TaxID=32201 RepID=A0A8T1R3Y3_CARIL|nr:hypothetical protein CIPAW_03G155700 [Carya illinoinensis]
MPSPLFAFTSHLSLTSSSSGWYQLSGSDATSPVAVNGGDRRCYDWTESDFMFRMLIGICGSDAVGLWSRFLRLHLSQYVYIYNNAMYKSAFLLCSYEADED